MVRIRPAGDALSDRRIIKKYPNRRLYDTELSRYITISDLRKLIVEGGEFEVHDANTGEDITRNILLQIINDQESGGKPMFTSDVLTQMIRFYGAGAQDLFAQYLSRSMELFIEQQRGYQNQFREMFEQSPMGRMSELARKNMEIWQEMQNQFLRSAGLAPAERPGRSDKPDREPGAGAEQDVNKADKGAANGKADKGGKGEKGGGSE